MPERRHEQRAEAGDRRSFPRPPLWLNLLLLVVAIAGIAYARYDRQRVSNRFQTVLTQEQRTPSDVRKIKDQLAGMNLTEAQLQKELSGRAQFLQSLQSQDFFISVDTQEKKLRFYYGNTVLREAPLTVGENADITGPDGRRWTFVPVKGSFKIESKVVDYPWQVPEWVYAMNKEPVPASRPTIEDGLGKYVIVIGNGYVIHSQPDEKSPLKGAKPGSFMVPDDDLRAIWPRIHIGTPVYIF